MITQIVKVHLKEKDPEFDYDQIKDFSRLLLRVESTNHCNFKCSFCPHPSMEREKGFMSEDLYKKIIDEAAELGFYKLDLRNFGEPIIDKRLGRLAKYAYDKGLNKIYIHTNGYGISEKILKRWAEGGITDVNISLSPKREFASTRPGTNVDRLFSQIEKLMMSDSPYKHILSMDYIKTGNSTDEEEKEFLNWIEKIGLAKRIDINLHNWAQGDESVEYKMCHRLWTSVTVLWDGRVSLCCLDYEGEVCLGNVAETPLKDIINSEVYKDIRHGHRHGFFINKCVSCDMPIVKDEGPKATFTKIG